MSKKWYWRVKRFWQWRTPVCTYAICLKEDKPVKEFLKKSSWKLDFKHQYHNLDTSPESLNSINWVESYHDPYHIEWQLNTLGAKGPKEILQYLMKTVCCKDFVEILMVESRVNRGSFRAKLSELQLPNLNPNPLMLAQTLRRRSCGRNIPRGAVGVNNQGREWIVISSERPWRARMAGGGDRRMIF